MTPHEMCNDFDKEWEYIRAKTEELNDMKKKQRAKGDHGYRHGDRLMVHSYYSKTNERFVKRRKQFDRLARFIQYQNGNCLIKLDQPIENKQLVEVPIYFTKKI